jgi:hypothetical protein
MGDRDAFAPQSSQPQPLNPNGTMSGPIDASVPVPDESEQFSMYEPPQEFFLYTWFKEQTLIKVGSVIFFFGAVWFVSYAIEQNWISPLMRIALGLLLACSIYGVGYWRQRFEVVQFQVLTVLGSAVFMGTVVASQFAFSNPVLPPLAGICAYVGKYLVHTDGCYHDQSRVAGNCGCGGGLACAVFGQYAQPVRIPAPCVPLASLGWIVDSSLLHALAICDPGVASGRRVACTKFVSSIGSR